MTKVAVVVPSNRPDRLSKFLVDWSAVFDRHKALVVEVEDGDDPRAVFNLAWCGYTVSRGDLRRSDLKPEHRDLIYDHTDSVRNLGFLALARWSDPVDVVITLDDDVAPWDHNDPIQEHLDALRGKTSLYWFNHCSPWPRGFPYRAREEADVWVSHGVWRGVHDYDAPTQLVQGNLPMNFYQGPVPYGALMPVCGMNLAWRWDAAPFVYFAPMGPLAGVNRFGDIWMGVCLKRSLDRLGKAMVTGYSAVHHTRASDVFVNLQQEAKGIAWNEHVWKENPGGSLPPEAETYLTMYAEKRQRWYDLMTELMKKGG